MCFSLSVDNNTHASYASVFRRQLMTIHMLLIHVFRIHLLFYASIFRRQSVTTHMLLMHVFHGHLLLCANIFLSSVHMLLMHVLHGHLLLMYKYLFVVRTYASNAYASWRLAFYVQVFLDRPYTCF